MEEKRERGEGKESGKREPCPSMKFIAIEIMN